MTMVKYLFLSVLLILLFDNVLGDHAKAYKITMCNADTYYPVIVNDADIEEKNSQIFVSGSISTDENLTTPVRASITLKRYVSELQIWVQVPCIGNFGSCTYNDLCSYGISGNSTCPSNFIENKVPCRCPISAGTYTLKPENKMYLFTVPKKIHLLHKLSTPATGTYWVEVKVFNDKDLFSCYQLYVDYSDVTKNEVENEVLPFLDLVR